MTEPVLRSLLVFGEAFGMPDPSPFCMKARSLLAIANLPYDTAEGDVMKAPKKKLPVLIENGVPIPDTTFMRLHLEQKHGIDFDRHLTPEQVGHAWALEKLCEDNLYWHIMFDRWMVPHNFDRGPKAFFQSLPAFVRPVLIPIIKRDIRVALKWQGTGRHSRAEIHDLARRGIDAIAAALGDKPWICGDEPCGADASVHATVTALLCALFESDLLAHTQSHENLVAYRARGLAAWYPDFVDQT
ncbi:MAG: glutathione S-transferase family protein [Pseudomonadota bacterium]